MGNGKKRKDIMGNGKKQKVNMGNGIEQKVNEISSEKWKKSSEK